MFSVRRATLGRRGEASQSRLPHEKGPSITWALRIPLDTSTFTSISNAKPSGHAEAAPRIAYDQPGPSCLPQWLRQERAFAIQLRPGNALFAVA